MIWGIEKRKREDERDDFFLFIIWRRWCDIETFNHIFVEMDKLLTSKMVGCFLVGQAENGDGNTDDHWSKL